MRVIYLGAMMALTIPAAAQDTPPATAAHMEQIISALAANNGHLASLAQAVQQLTQPSQHSHTHLEGLPSPVTMPPQSVMTAAPYSTTAPTMRTQTHSVHGPPQMVSAQYPEASGLALTMPPMIPQIMQPGEHSVRYLPRIRMRPQLDWTPEITKQVRVEACPEHVPQDEHEVYTVPKNRKVLLRECDNTRTCGSRIRTAFRVLVGGR